MVSSSFTCAWDEHPDRDEKWKEDEIGRTVKKDFHVNTVVNSLVFDETLLNSIKLASMEFKPVIMNMGPNTLV